MIFRFFWMILEVPALFFECALRESDCWKYLEVRDVPMVPMDPGGTKDEGMLG